MFKNIKLGFEYDTYQSNFENENNNLKIDVVLDSNHFLDKLHNIYYLRVKFLDRYYENKKIKEERKIFQRSDFKPKTIANITDTRKLLSLKTIPQTSIEKIVKTMNKIKEKLIYYNQNDLVEEAEWVIKEILSDKMYKIKIHEKTSKEESDFYNEYSNNRSEILLSKDISNYGKNLYS